MRVLLFLPSVSSPLKIDICSDYGHCFPSRPAFSALSCIFIFCDFINKLLGNTYKNCKNMCVSVCMHTHSYPLKKVGLLNDLF